MARAQTGRSSTKVVRSKRTSRIALPSYVIAYVWARAAGRCEFPGCNEPLWMDVLTTKEANFGKLAHIVGASADGPRGDPVESPRLAKDPSNIMLLCGTHHDLVDNKKHECTYPKELLREYKARHESRIETLTAIAESQKSVPILVEIPVGAHALQTPPTELSLAIAAAGFYPDDTRKIRIDMNGMTGRDHDTAFWQEARDRLADELTRHLRAIAHNGPIQHASVFAFGPMPLLIFLGHLLDEKMAAHVFNRIRRPNGWIWPTHRRRITKLTISAPAKGVAREDVALSISMSSEVQRTQMHECVPATMPVFALGRRDPRLDCIRSPEELAHFVDAAHEVMERIHRAQATRVHLFPAIPVAAAVEFGRSLQKKLHAPIVIYDYHRASGGWRETFEIVARSR